MVELADQSANGTYEDTTDRKQLQKEVAELKNEINRIADSSNFNGIKLLDGSLAGGANVKDQLLGSAKVSFSLGVTDATIAGNEATITFQDGKAATGIKVDFSADDGSVKITLGSQAAATYTADQITQAVRDAAAAYGAGGSTNAAEISKAYASFTMTSDGPISASAGGSLTMAEQTFADGTGNGLTLQIGDTSDSFNQLNVSINDCHIASLGIDGIDISTQKGAQDAVNVIKSAINYVSDVRGTLGATQNRLDHTINNLSVMEENIQDAESTIRDTDVADEMMAYTKNNILIQSAQAMLAQANQVPQGVLQLLQ